jgi:hypothetical protein
MVFYNEMVHFAAKAPLHIREDSALKREYLRAKLAASVGL